MRHQVDKAPLILWHTTTGVPSLVRIRLENMLTAYAHPSCHALLFWTNTALHEARQLLNRLDLTLTYGSIFDKAEIIYPAVRAVSLRDFTSKWAEEIIKEVVFCGIDFESKNGPLVTNVIENLAANFKTDAHFSYIGHLPEGARKRLEQYENVSVYGTLNHSQVHRIFNRAHILLHPSKYESLGMVLVEACGAGMAVVVSENREIQVASEIFEDGGAISVKTDTGSTRDAEQGFIEAVASLLQSDLLAKRLAQLNYERCTIGRFSSDKRNEQLTRIYQRSTERRTREPLRLAHLPNNIGPTKTYSSGALLRDSELFRNAHGLTGRRFVTSIQYAL